MTRARPRQIIASAVFAAFFVSGFCGLVHQVAWSRLLRHVMGNDTFAITTVLCAFMGGLALGSFAGGRIIGRRDDPLRVFAVLEFTIGVYCMALPWLIGAAEPLYRVVYQHTHASFYVFSLIRFAFCGLLILVPATFMGATLPVLTRFFVRSLERVGWSVGALYAVNTLGSVFGAFVTGFLLIQSIGLMKTISLAGLLNVSVGVTAALLHRHARGHEVLERETAAGPAATGAARYGRPALAALLIGYGLSGFAALVYEIAWTRVISLLIASTVYAFSMMLTAFILGLAVGAMIAARFSDRARDPMRSLALVQVGIGLSALSVVPFFGWLPLHVTGLISRLGGSFWQLQAAEFGLILLIMLVPTTLMGAAFPLASRVFVRRADEAARSVGAVYAANTLGAILGSFVGGFVFIPWLGIQKTLLAVVSINILIACGFFAFSRSMTPGARGAASAGAAVVALAGMLMIPPWDVSRMTVGPFIRARQLLGDVARSPEALETLTREERVIFHKEGVSTTVTVKEDAEGRRVLLTNGLPEAFSRGGRGQQALLAHIPMLLHPNPRSALVIGLASGVTLASAGRHPVETLDCVEISPAVVEATRLFADVNDGILDDPRLDLIIMDGRNHLALTPREYDVIISQPSVPWVAGVGDLFTREFFELCRDRLAPGGIACVWIQAATAGPEAFRSVVRTFNEVFAQVTIWKAAPTDFLLVGGTAPLAVDYAELARRMAAGLVGEDLRRISITSIPDLLAYLVTGDHGARELADDAPLHTDDNALLEFSIPRTLADAEGLAARLDAIERHRAPDVSFLVGPPDRQDTLERIKARAQLWMQARGHVERANVARWADDTDLVVAEVRRAAELNPTDPLLREYVETLASRARDLVTQGRFADAASVYAALAAIDPDNAAARFLLAVALRQTGRREEALAQFEAAVGLDSDLVAALNGAAWILATHPVAARRDAARAVEYAGRAARLTGARDADVLDTLAAAYAEAGRFDEAVETAEAAAALASAAGDARVDEIRGRAALYRRREPYRETEGP